MTTTPDAARRWARAALCALAAVTLSAACSATGGNAAGSGGGGGAGAGAAAGGGAPGGAGGNGGEIGGIDAGGLGGSGGLDPDAACAAVSSEADSDFQPADIIIAVDTSGSMDEESAQVQQNLNAFASIITKSGIDVHVILIAAPEVCIPAPLGSGACPADDNPPAYHHTQQPVASHDALQQILATYPDWKGFLRANASKTIAVVSDDDSDMGAADFTNQLLALDPSFAGFKFDAIVSFEGPDVCFGCLLNCAGCQSACCNKSLLCEPLSAAEGAVYKQLVTQTGGVLGDLCAQNFDPVFKDMATAVVKGSTISCEYEIPPPPAGSEFDPGKVNVVYEPAGGPPQKIFNVPGGEAACGAEGGWYYDDPAAPKKIVLCPSTCAAVQGDAEGKIEVQFGCDTERVPPK